MERDRDLEHNDPARPLKHHPGFRRIFAEGRLTLGFMFPVVRVENVMPDMTGQIDIASRIDALGFSALWIRDVPIASRAIEPRWRSTFADGRLQ